MVWLKKLSHQRVFFVEKKCSIDRNKTITLIIKTRVNQA